MSMTIIEFLKARIAEDEAAEARKVSLISEKINNAFGECSLQYIGANEVIITPHGGRTGFHMSAAEFDAEYTEPAPDQRMLAECAAKRAILEQWESPDGIGPFTGDVDAGYVMGIDTAVRALAAVYKEHPDYRQEWSE
jgi:hypothetical protein